MKNLIEMKKWAETRYDRETDILIELKNTYPELTGISFGSFYIHVYAEHFTSTINFDKYEYSYQIKATCDGNIPETEEEFRTKMDAMLTEKEWMNSCSQYIIDVLEGESNEEL